MKKRVIFTAKRGLLALWVISAVFSVSQGKRAQFWTLFALAPRVDMLKLITLSLWVLLKDKEARVENPQSCLF